MAKNEQDWVPHAEPDSGPHAEPHPHTGKVRIHLTMPYFDTVKEAEEWIRAQMPNLKRVTPASGKFVGANVTIRIQVARPAVKWE